MGVNRTQVCNTYYFTQYFYSSSICLTVYTRMYTVWMKNQVIGYKVLPVLKNSPVFWIRVHCVRIRIQHFRLNTDLDPGFL